MSRRTRGKREGSIGQRKDGRWCARIDLGYQNGRRRRKSIYGYTRAEVAAALTATLASTAKGEPIPNARATFASLIKQWLDSIAPPVRRPRTVEFYELLTRLHIVPAIGNVHLAKLEPAMIQSLLSQKSKEGLSPGTVRHIRATLRRALNFGVRMRMLSFNAASHVETPAAEHEIVPLSSDDAARLLDAAKDTPIGALLVLAVRLGLRRGELLGLQWSDVNLDDRTLSIQRSIQRIPGRPLEAAPLKTRGSRRAINLPEEVMRTLRRHRADQAEHRLAAGNEWNDMGLVFPNSIGKPLEPRRVDELFKRCLKTAGAPAATRFHDTRHTCAALLLAAGADLFSVSRLLGHASISITADTYGHITPGGAQRLTAQMDAVMPAK
jgi:integrase